MLRDNNQTILKTGKIIFIRNKHCHHCKSKRKAQKGHEGFDPPQ